MERTYKLSDYTEVSFEQLQQIAFLRQYTGWKLILRLAEDKKRGLLENLHLAESDEDILRAAKEYRLAVQECVDLAYWPEYCDKLIEEELADGTTTGREDQGAAGGGGGESWGEPAAEPDTGGYEPAT